MLSQQMRSCDSTKIEAVVPSATGPLKNQDACRFVTIVPMLPTCSQLGLNCRHLSPTDTPSIALTNYNFHPTSKLQSTIEDSTLPLPTLIPKTQRFDRDACRFVPITTMLTTCGVLGLNCHHPSPIDDSLRFPFQRSSVDWVYSYFEDFSQSTACNAIRFGECSSTSLDRLWYLYSYIYKPTTTICYGIFIFLNSRHTSPIRSLPSVKHTTTPSTSLPLFTTRSFTTSSSTTRSTLQLSILLESTSAPSLSITLGPFFVNFIKSIIFLSLAAVDYKDNDPESPTRPDIRYKFESLHASPFRFLAISTPTTPFISIPFCTTNSTLHLLAFLESTVPSLPPPSRTLFVIFFLSPVRAVGRDTDAVTSTTTSYVSPSNFIKSIIFLSLSSVDNNSQASKDIATIVGDTEDKASPAVTIITNDTTAAVYFAVFDVESSADIMKTTTSSYLLSNNNRSSFNNGDIFGRTGTTTHILRSRRTTDILRSQRLKLFARNDAPVPVTMTTHVSSSPSEHVSSSSSFTVAVAPAVAVGAPSVVKMTTYAAIFITLLGSHIIDHGSLLYLTQQILLYNQQYVYDGGNNDSVSSVTVTYAVTMSSVTIIYAVTMTTSADEAQYDYHYCDTAVSIVSPFTVTVGATNNMTSAVSIASPSIGIDTESSIVIDAESSAVITKTTTSSSRLSNSNRSDSSTATMRMLLYKLNTVSDVDTMFKLNVDTTSPAIMKSYNTVYNLYFNTVFDSRSSISNDSDSFGRILLVIQHDPSIYNNPSSFNNAEDYSGRTGNNDNHYGDTTVSNSLIVTLKTYDTIYDLYFDTVVAITVAVGAPFVITMTTCDSSYHPTGTVLCPVYQQTIVAPIFITLLPSHIIDHGSVSYLTLQILLYNQQYVYDDGNKDSVSSVTVTYAVTMSSITVTYAVTMKTSADEAQYDCYYCDTAVSIASPSTVTVGDTDNMTSAVTQTITSHGTCTTNDGCTGEHDIDSYFDTVFDTAVSIASPSLGIDTESSIVIDTEFSTVSVASNTAPSTGNDSLATVTFDTVHSLYFDITFNTAINTAFTSASHVSPSNDIDSTSSAIYDGDSSAGNDSPTAVMVEPYDMQRDTSVLYDRNLSAITIMTTAVKMMTNDMNTAVYLAVIDAESSADITNAISSCASPQIISVLSTLMSLHRTLHLIITSLLFLFSNPYFDTISC